SPGAIPYVAPSKACRAFKYWIHTDDQRWEIRDTQWLAGALVSSGVADPSKLAITGGSYGGGQTIQNALLRDRIRCGGAKQFTAVDACAGKPDGAFAPWTTADGSTPLRWVVAIPMYTWYDVIEALSPNGRNSDGEAVPDGNHTDPVGVPIQSYLAGLYAAAQPLGNGYVAPPGTARTLAGNPFPKSDPVIANTIAQYETFKSARGIPPDGIIPIFWVQGETDPLFTAFHPLQLANRLRAFDPSYPIKLFFGDIGHDYAAERVDEWDAAHLAMNSFLDHYLTGAGPAPSFDVTAAITRCLNHDAPMELVEAPTWSALHPLLFERALRGPKVTTSSGPSVVGVLADPVSQATITQNPLSYRGCRKIDARIVDPNAARWRIPIASPVTMIGAPVIDLNYSSTAPDTELAVRLWDVDFSSGTRALVTRGVYRSLDGPGTAGHTITLEVTANDAPYYQPSNVPAVVVVRTVRLTLPCR
ncbi:MAG: hypothetical protein E6G68_08165, partial [Actinobacteria bacterium]